MFARTLLFNLVFYVNFVALGVLLSPSLLLPRAQVQKVAKFWAASNLWWHRLIVGVDEELRGLEYMPTGGAIVAAKHQSVWETMRLIALLPDAAYVLKRELMWIPLFGWYLARSGMIPVDRGKRSKALDGITRHAGEALSRGRQVIIFPEGTRRSPGAEPSYKYGVTHLYARLHAPVVPVAINAGLFWPRRAFSHRRGTIVLEFLPAIPPGLPKSDFASLLQERIETASARLIEESGRARPPEPGPGVQAGAAGS